MRAAALAIAAAVIVADALISQSINSASAKLIFSDIMSVLTAAASTAAMAWAAWRTAAYSKRTASAWWMFAASQCCFLAGETLWSVQELFFHRQPFPSISDVFFMLQYPAVLGGVVLLPKVPLNGREWLAVALDIGVIAITALALWWNFLLSPMLVGVGSATLYLSIAYPVLDLVVLIAISDLLLRRLKVGDRSALRWLVLGIVVEIATDFMFGMQSVAGTYLTGNLLDVGWVAFVMLCAVAGVHQAAATGEGVTEPDSASLEDHQPATGELTRIAKYMPFVWIVLAYGLLCLSASSPLAIAHQHIVALVGVITLLTLARQALALRENALLAARLRSELDERRNAEAYIDYLAHHDHLTTLPNRVLFKQRFGLAVSTARRTGSKIALMFLDLDRFKSINDTLGHHYGDHLLKAVAERLKDCLHANDLICRHGGDEFLIMLPRVESDEHVEQVAREIANNLSRHFDLDGHPVRTSFSIGISLFPDHGEDYHALLKRADTAMYRAKEKGRNTHQFFTDKMNIDSGERLQLENRMRIGIDRGDFSLQFQPLVDTARGRATAVEALLRWDDAEYGRVSPGKFIPIAEESGLIVPLGDWVLQEACLQARRWIDAGLDDIVVAVNISALQFRREEFVGTVTAALRRATLKPRHLELEITESALVVDPDRVAKIIRKLKRFGIGIAIDDFGTGYSSLSYLKRFNVDKLKIDQSFVRDLTDNPDDAAIVHAIITMAHDIKLSTVAEGVEAIDQVVHLRKAGCTTMQGYFFCRPMSADDTTAFLRNAPPGLPDPLPETP